MKEQKGDIAHFENIDQHFLNLSKRLQDQILFFITEAHPDLPIKNFRNVTEVIFEYDDIRSKVEFESTAEQYRVVMDNYINPASENLINKFNEIES